MLSILLDFVINILLSPSFWIILSNILIITLIIYVSRIFLKELADLSSKPSINLSPKLPNETKGTDFRKKAETFERRYENAETKLREKDDIIKQLNLEIERLELEKNQLAEKLTKIDNELSERIASFWPSELNSAVEIKSLLQTIESNFQNNDSHAMILKTELDKLGLNLNNKDEIGTLITPMSTAFYSWLNNSSYSNEFATHLATWLNKSLDQLNVNVKVINVGDPYNENIHDCSAPTGPKVSLVKSFLILRNGRTVKKASVEVQ